MLCTYIISVYIVCKYSLCICFVHIILFSVCMLCTYILCAYVVYIYSLCICWVHIFFVYILCKYFLCVYVVYIFSLCICCVHMFFVYIYYLCICCVHILFVYMRYDSISPGECECIYLVLYILHILQYVNIMIGYMNLSSKTISNIYNFMLNTHTPFTYEWLYRFLTRFNKRTYVIRTTITNTV